jgi:GNAT superfamily N-acetyltransferase
MSVLASTLTKVRTTGARIVAEYENGQEERPIGGYVRAMATYGSLVTGLTVAGRARGVRLPERVPYDDLALLTVATFRGSRLLAKSAVASPLRAPFTEFAGPGGPGEVKEEVTAEGHLHAVGELLTCPFCLGQWIGTLLMAGYLADPRRTRWVAATLTAAAVSDALQLAYARLEG